MSGSEERYAEHLERMRRERLAREADRDGMWLGVWITLMGLACLGLMAALVVLEFVW
jgi:hypothetical protein